MGPTAGWPTFLSSVTVPEPLSVTLGQEMSVSVLGLVISHRSVNCQLLKQLEPVSFAEFHFLILGNSVEITLLWV